MQQGEKQKRVRKLRLLLSHMWVCAYVGVCAARLLAHAGGSFAQSTGATQVGCRFRLLFQFMSMSSRPCGKAQSNRLRYWY
jgi:hypothetical protein